MTEYDGSTVASNKLIFTEKFRFHIDRKQAKIKPPDHATVVKTLILKQSCDSSLLDLLFLRSVRQRREPT